MAFQIQKNLVFRTVGLYHFLGGLFGLYNLGLTIVNPHSQVDSQLLNIFGVLLFITSIVSGTFLIRSNIKSILWNKILLALQFFQFSVFGVTWFFSSLVVFNFGYISYRSSPLIPSYISLDKFDSTIWLGSEAHFYTNGISWAFYISPLPILLFILMSKEEKAIKRKTKTHRIGTTPSEQEIEERTNDMYN